MTCNKFNMLSMRTVSKFFPDVRRVTDQFNSDLNNCINNYNIVSLPRQLSASSSGVKNVSAA
jgi:hypothetical protein